MQWFSTVSCSPDSSTALAECVAEVRRQFGDVQPDLVFAFLTEHHRDIAERFSEGLQAVLPHRHLLGCTAAAVIGGGNEVEGAPGMSLTVAILPDVDIHPFHVTRHTSQDVEDRPGWEAQLGVTALDAPDFVVLADPLTFDPSTLVTALDHTYPQATIVGGLASGSNVGNMLLVDDEVHESGAIGIGLTGNIEVDTIVAQGCKPIGEPMFITGAHQSLLVELDGLPAVEMLGKTVQKLTRAEQVQAQTSLFMGIAMVAERTEYAQGDFLIRNIVGVMPDQNGLLVAALLEPNNVVQFHLRDAETSARDVELLLTQHADERPEPAGALLFSCLGRGEGLYGEPSHDTHKYLELVGGPAPGGLFCNGEIGPLGGSTWLHGYTSVFATFRPRARH